MHGEDDDMKRGEEFSVAGWLIIIYVTATILAALVTWPMIDPDVPIEAFLLCGAIGGFFLGRYMP
jgi:hypothetical protein